MTLPGDRIEAAFAAARRQGRIALLPFLTSGYPALESTVPALKAMADAGADVTDIGMVGTEMLYFAVGSLGLDGGIAVTASHNPKEYTGMKIVRRGALPVGGDSHVLGDHAGDFAVLAYDHFGGGEALYFIADQDGSGRAHGDQHVAGSPLA